MKNKIIRGKKFCIRCGSQCKAVKSTVFDGDTGLPVFNMYCMNTKCVIGCGNTEEGHLWVKKTNRVLIFFEDYVQCSRCEREQYYPDSWKSTNE